MGACSSCVDADLRETLKHVREEDGSEIVCDVKRPFANWSLQYRSQPLLTFVPRTKAGICNIVRWARLHKKKVRACGYRHTFSPLYPDEGSVFISMLPLRDAEELPSRPNIPLNDRITDLVGIRFVKHSTPKKAWIRVGAATSNDQLRNWAIAELKAGRPSWTLPFNVIMTEITLGGSNAVSSHGAGSRHQTLSDLVREIEFVNVLGELQVVNRPDQLRAAAGCLGLLGIVTSLTMEFDEMTYAAFHPLVMPLEAAIPPLQPYIGNGLIRAPCGPLGEENKQQKEKGYQQANDSFATLCEESYYAEWFWFVFTDQCFVNCWKQATDPQPSEITFHYPSPDNECLQQWTSHLMETFRPLVDLLPDEMETRLSGGLGLIAAAGGAPPVCTPLVNGLHFRQGIQNLRAKNVEVLLPIPLQQNGKPDWSFCQKVWWEAISLIEEYRLLKKYPVRTALEMRVIGDSNVLLAPEAGNHRTCSIEVVTFLNTPEADWLEFTQALVNKWAAHTDHNGEPVKIRMHWAKQWEHLRVGGVPYMEYYKTHWRQNIEQFNHQLQAIAAAGGYERRDLVMFQCAALTPLLLTR